MQLQEEVCITTYISSSWQHGFVHDCGWEVGTGWSLKTLPTQPSLGFHDPVHSPGLQLFPDPTIHRSYWEQMTINQDLFHPSYKRLPHCLKRFSLYKHFSSLLSPSCPPWPNPGVSLQQSLSLVPRNPPPAASCTWRGADWIKSELTEQILSLTVHVRVWVLTRTRLTTVQQK